MDAYKAHMVSIGHPLPVSIYSQMDRNSQIPNPVRNPDVAIPMGMGQQTTQDQINEDIQRLQQEMEQAQRARQQQQQPSFFQNLPEWRSQTKVKSNPRGAKVKAQTLIKPKNSGRSGPQTPTSQGPQMSAQDLEDQENTQINDLINGPTQIIPEVDEDMHNSPDKESIPTFNLYREEQQYGQISPKIKPRNLFEKK